MNYPKFCCCVQAVNMLKTTRPLHLTRWVAAPPEAGVWPSVGGRVWVCVGDAWSQATLAVGL